MTGDPLDVEDVPFADRLDDFYAPSVSLARLKAHPDVSSPADLLLRALEPPPIKIRHIPLLDLLRPAYRRLASIEKRVQE
ncbi:hypothetical protein Acor_07090 [Acrocarpospora corrugata]|uniref:Uncharacterized protein n=1 Tax=Acrocarpospora corrugata TaxID=35763 RepID=A0A5M3VW70_9ACTN|nr:hypothetical protein [Acrocarpospora corrugata]GER98647.1 hypothetical protein Acor_07090 [Acrocarpospora corrugata]